MNEEYPKEEAERRAAANLARMLATPPKPKKKAAEAPVGPPGYKLGRQQPGPATPARSAPSKPGKRGQSASGS